MRKGQNLTALLLLSALISPALGQNLPVDESTAFGEVRRVPHTTAQHEIKLITSGPFIKGFPVLIVIDTKDYKPPLVSIFHTLQMETVELVSKADNRKYIIESGFTGPELIYREPGHGLSGGNPFQWYTTPYAEDATRAVLDLASLKSLDRNGITLADVPPGAYTLQIFFRHRLGNSIVESPPTSIELKAPTPGEEKYLIEAKSRMLASFPDPTRVRWKKDAPVNWTDVLVFVSKIDDLSTETLSDEAKGQLALHLLNLKVVTSKDKLQDFDYAGVDKIMVPSYVEPEKESLRLEVKILAGKEDEVKDEVAQLIKKHPGLKWRIAMARNKESEFLSSTYPVK